MLTGESFVLEVTEAKIKGPIMEFLDIFESRPLVFTPSIYPCSITGKFFRVGDHLFFFKNTYTGIDSPF